MRQMHESLTVLIQVGNEEYEILANLEERKKYYLDSNTIDLNLRYFYYRLHPYLLILRQL